MPSKVVTAAEVVGRIQDGMTVGIGGWGSRRKPMALVRPYVTERSYWIMKHHGVFQGVYWFQHIGADPNARDHWADHPWYQACADFCANYDQNSFDPDYPWEPLEFFVPMVRRVLSEPHGGTAS